MNIYLIGMPGCGKSSIGIKAAKQLEYNYIDMDNYIENKYKMTIKEIFDKLGEEEFRKYEKEVFNEFMNLSNTIISCGGGVIKDYSNKSLLKGVVVYIKSDLESIKKRVLLDTINYRPLLQVSSVEELFEQRKDAYIYFSDIEIDNIILDNAVNDLKRIVSLKIKK